MREGHAGGELGLRRAYRTCRDQLPANAPPGDTLSGVLKLTCRNQLPADAPPRDTSERDNLKTQSTALEGDSSDLETSIRP